MHSTYTQHSNAATIRVIGFILLALAALFGLFAWSQPEVDRTTFSLHASIFLVGPVLVVLDRYMLPAQTLWQHHSVTALRIVVLLGIYALVPTTINSMTGYLWNFFCVYLTVWFALMQFSVKPLHWLRYDNRANTAFIAAIVVSLGLEIGFRPVQKGLGSWLLAGLLIAMLLAWRHALWYYVNTQLSPKQHRYVWPALATRRTPAFFWRDIYYYITDYPGLDPVLSTLDLPVLLNFFTLEQSFFMDPLVENNVHDFRECVKAQINEKEPRAVFIWHLYPEAEAARFIEAIDTHVQASQTEAMELPDL